MVKVKRPVVLVGESGTSKTATIQNFLSNLNTDTTVSPLLSHKLFKTKNNALQLTLTHRITRCIFSQIMMIINFSSRTTSMDLQRTLEASVEKRTKDTYGPPMGKRLLVFMDDLNMPRVRMDLYYKSYLTLNFHLTAHRGFTFVWSQVDEYGTQQPIALLKLLLDRGGMYDRGKELNYKLIKDLGFIAAMGKAGGGRNEVDPRFISLFSVFNIPFPQEESLHLIYSSILKGHTKVWEIIQLPISEQMAIAVIKSYKSLYLSILCTCQHNHILSIYCNSFSLILYWWFGSLF